MSPYPELPGLEITALLGRGGMATVYAARQVALGREVAVKVVDLDGPYAQQQLQRLENEAQSLAQLRHPGIVGLYDFGRTAEGSLYYVMALLEGGDLSSRSRPMAEDAVIKLLDRLLDALDHAHKFGIVHRDIKPENILFDGEDHPLLADFGAAIRPNRSRLTEVGMAIGSAGYMSPEQARGALVDGRSDLYSVGVVAYELLSGRLPFDGPDALSIALAQAEQTPAELPANLQHWQRFLDRALALDPEKRFGSAQEMRSALSDLYTRQAPSTLPQLPRGRSPILWLLPFGVLILAGLWWYWQANSEQTRFRHIETLISSGQLMDPAQPNALNELEAFSQRTDEATQRLRDQLLEALWQETQEPLRQADWLALAAPLKRWQQAINSLQASERGLVVAQREALAETVAPKLSQGLANFDKAALQPLLILLQDLQPLPESLREAFAQAQALPLPEESFSDPMGPELVLLRLPHQQQPGLAIMRSALQPEFYQRFLADRNRPSSDCENPAEQVQGCLSLADANALAQWLSEQTGQPYRMPSLEELRQNYRAMVPSAGLAWTSSCQEVTSVTRPNAAQRTWGKVKSVFGGNAAQNKVQRYCSGNWLLALADGKASARSSASAQTTVVLVREIQAKVETVQGAAGE